MWKELLDIPKRRDPRVLGALQIKQIDFGTVQAGTDAGDSFSVETDYGLWKITSCTATDTQNRIAWITAPWGCEYREGKFVGEPCMVDWDDASMLFGKGQFRYSDRWGHQPETLTNDPDDWAETAFRRGFTSGTCRVVFAGYSDWRLPTVQEWCFLTKAVSFDLHDRVMPSVSRNVPYWTASGLEHPLWGKRGGISWLGRFTVPLDENARMQYPILLVRRI